MASVTLTRRTTAIAGGLLILALAMLPAWSRAQTAAGGEKAPVRFASVDSGEAPIETNADELNYDRTTGWIVAKGDVVINKGPIKLTADYVRVNVETEMAHAYGHVVLHEADSVWNFTSLDYNFQKGTGKATGATGVSGTFRILENESIEKLDDVTFGVNNALVTTCTNEQHATHYRVKSGRVIVVPEDYLKAKGAVFYLGRVPVMYLPYWRKNLNDDFGWELEPGHSSRWGTYLLTAYRYRMSDVFKGRTHLDLRSDRGVAVGQDLKWISQTRGTGGITGYYADDSNPVQEDEPATANLESERYRIRLDHFVQWTTRDSVTVRANYLSDRLVTRDFFEDEYRLNPVPENDVTYTRRGERYTLNLLARSRLNDFFTYVNRLPELSADFIRQQIGDSRFYYEGETSLAYLEHQFAEGNGTLDYSSSRFDTLHRIYYPTRHFGFLNFNPRVGARGTYYSDTRFEETTTTVENVIRTNTIADAFGILQTVVTSAIESNTVTRNVSAGSAFREQIEFGFDTSFKGFRVFDAGWYGQPMRHVAEPYLEYSYASEPSLLPEEIYYFDEVDTLRERNFIRLGMRNKLQVKRGGLSANLIDLDLFTFLHFEELEGQGTLGDIFLKAEMHPSGKVRFDIDGNYNSDASQVEAFNMRLQMRPQGRWNAGLEQRFLQDLSNLTIASLTLRPTFKWHFNLYGRYEFEDSQTEEVGGYIQRNFDCMAYRLGGRFLPGFVRGNGSEREDDYKVTFEFWLNAVPGIGHKRDDWL
jgi:LPS-assembly protein